MAAAWFDIDDEEPPVEVEAEIVEKPPAPVDNTPVGRWLAQRQRKIFEESAEVLETALLAREIDPMEPEPPNEWVLRWGEKEAARRYRVACSAWQNAKQAPVLLKLAKEAFVGISKALAEDKSGPRVLNLQIVAMPGTSAVPMFPEQDDVEQK